MKPDLERLKARHAAALAAQQDAYDHLVLTREAAIQAALGGREIPSGREAWTAVEDANEQADALTIALARATGETMQAPVAVHRTAQEILVA